MNSKTHSTAQGESLVIHPLYFSLRRFSIVLALLMAQAHARDWPKDCVLDEASRSPDGHYGILIATSPDVDDAGTYLIAADGEEFVNYFANLTTHKVLGKISKGNYVQREPHRHLSVDWTPDSKLCIATYWDRFGFSSAVAIQPKESSITQNDLGQRIQDSIKSTIARQSHSTNKTGATDPHFRPAPDGKIRSYATATTNPKSFDDVKTYYALFRGTFDLNSRKWLSADSQPINAAQYESMDTASTDFRDDLLIVSSQDFKDPGLDGNDVIHSDGKVLFRSEEAKAKYLDGQLNEVYRAVRAMLPPAQFAKVKSEQIEWLKKRDATDSIPAKSKLLETRITALQDTLW